MNIEKVDELDKKVKILINFLKDLKKQNLKYEDEINIKNLEIKVYKKEIFEMKKNIFEYENMKKKYLQIRNNLEAIYKKLEQIEINL
ncbi:MAG: hypothetical protein LBF97_04785 [Elusimicrobiota bacterium]|jgi:hypothetical protein|nr:hypothetical protein [Elusimicrobiota bacterium]